MRSRRKDASVSYVGVFWADISVDCRKVKIYTEKIRVEDGENYNLGQFKIFPKAHIDVWHKIRKKNPKWKEILNYEDIPRGRVAFRKYDSKFIVIFGSDCDTDETKKAIVRVFKLSYSNCEFLKDLHYELPENYES
jgi:hypothetical protein